MFGGEGFRSVGKWGRVPDLVLRGVEERIGLGLARDGRGVCGDLAVCFPVAWQAISDPRSARAALNLAGLRSLFRQCERLSSVNRASVACLIARLAPGLFVALRRSMSRLHFYVCLSPIALGQRVACYARIVCWCSVLV